MFIYQIENLINNKKYVGSTNNPARRKLEHFNSAKWKSCASYDYPLQKAIRKYGEENFVFSILEECDLENTPEREKYWIQFLNTLTYNGKGYNQTLETQCALRDKELQEKFTEQYSQKCALVDDYNNIKIIYKSYHEAARENFNKDYSSNIRKVCKGEAFSINGKIFRDLDQNNEVIIPKNKTRQRKTKIYGININDETDIVYYESISEAARQEGIDRSSLSKCINGSTRYSKVHGRFWKRSDANE